MPRAVHLRARVRLRAVDGRDCAAGVDDRRHRRHPYGDAKLAAFPANIQQINADPEISLVAHLCCIKNGSSLCSDDYFNIIRSDFDTFQDPLVYAPGDKRVDHPPSPAGLQAPNVTRVVVDGSSNANDYLKLTIDASSSSVFGWTRVYYT